MLQTVRWKLAVVEEAKGDADAAARARIAQRCRRFIEEWEARKANAADAVNLLRATLEPIGTLGSRAARKELQRLGEACLAQAATWMCSRQGMQGWSRRSRLRFGRIEAGGHCGSGALK